MRQFLIALDQTLNCCVYAAGEGFGMADETLSARAWRLRYRMRTWDQFRRVIDALFFAQPNHCETAYRRELERRQLPAEYRPGVRA